jgi:pimeloyl-ACP methyl ester carboxylesterase
MEHAVDVDREESPPRRVIGVENRADRADPAFCFTASMAMAASYLEFTPGRPWESVRTPVLVTIGAADRMTTPSVTRESFDRATPPRAEYLEMRGVGHQMFLDHLQASFPPLVEWVRGRLVSI